MQILCSSSYPLQSFSFLLLPQSLHCTCTKHLTLFPSCLICPLSLPFQICLSLQFSCHVGYTVQLSGISSACLLQKVQVVYFSSIKLKSYIPSFTSKTFKNLVSSLLNEGKKDWTNWQGKKAAVISSGNSHFTPCECSPLPQLYFLDHELQQQSRPPPVLHP